MIDIIIEMSALFIGVWLALQIHIGNKWVISGVAFIMVLVVIIAYPMLAFSGAMSVHSFAGNVLFYLSFGISYFFAVMLIIGTIKHIINKD